MKKFGILIFIVAVMVGVVFANLFSFGRAATGQVFNFSFGSSVKGSGVSRSEAREVAGFKGVDVGGVLNVEIAAGKDFAVEVEADDNLLQYIRTEVRDGVLKIETSESIKSRNPLRVRISAPNLESVEASGASKVSLAGLKNNSLKINTSGASKISLEGTTSELNIDVSGASRIDAMTLKADNATVDASGASSVEVFVTGRLVSDASGASRISYDGNPTSVDKNSSGASRIQQK